jgi:hypothetical protein
MKQIGPILLPVLIALLMSSCGGAESPVMDTQTSGSLTARLQVVPYPPVPMEDSTLEVTLRDSEQQPVSGALVVFDLTMPAMEMPVNRPQATEEEGGVYRADAIFTMAGEWQIRVDVSYQGEDEVFLFPLRTR